MTVQPAPTPTESSVTSVADELSRLLADTYTLAMKTQGYHWNVSGPHFRGLHLLFEEEYVDLRDAADEIAERIRTLGPLAPGSYRQLSRLTSLAEDEGAPAALEMVRRLAADHEAVAVTARSVLEASEAAGDPATADLATRRIAVHDKACWMLRSTAADG
jgi:starvation-inducible DNA-binding protein